MPGTKSGVVRVGSGCGVSGCLYGAVGLFALLLVGMLVLAIFRFSRPPEPRLGPTPAPPGAAPPAADSAPRPAPR